MSKPRFKVGQVVVVIRAKRPERVGQVCTVTKVFWADYTADGWIQNADGYGTHWRYKLSCAPSHCAAVESQLRPYDPPASWDDEDMVWKPDALREPEKVST